MPIIKHPSHDNSRESLAKDAFWGINDKLMQVVLYLNGYWVGECFYPANSISLAATILTVKYMTDEELSKLKGDQ